MLGLLEQIVAFLSIYKEASITNLLNPAGREKKSPLLSDAQLFCFF